MAIYLIVGKPYKNWIEWLRLLPPNLIGFRIRHFGRIGPCSSDKTHKTNSDEEVRDDGYCTN